MKFASWKSRSIPLGIFAVGVVALALLASRAGVAEEAAAERVFELRTYVAAPGKLEALHARFRDHTNALFVEHGMTPIGYWTPSEGEGVEDTLIYILAHESRDAARKSWAGFAGDPKWHAARDASEKDGKLAIKVESRFMKATDYSPAK